MAFGFSGRRRRPGVVAALSVPSPALFVAPGLPATIGETTVLVRGRESPVATLAAASLNRWRSAVNNAAVLRPPDAPPVSQPATPPPATPVDFEGLGVFYMGERVDPDSGRGLAEPVLLKAKRLCTHAVCVGMTGSGKTGLLVGLLEEAALDGIPAVVIDPKGDLGSLLLSFPDLAPESFRPWVDPDAARREGLSVEELAGQTAARWSEGLAASGQSAERIARLRQSVEMAIYTPGSRAGRPLAMLGSLDPPTEAVRNDPERLRERLDSVASGILALAGIDAEPGRSREHVLLCTVIDALWKTGRPLSLGELIRALPAPPVERVGFFELEHFYPAADRFELAGRLNLVAASPGFEARLEGEPADIGRLLWTPAGRPRVSIVSIAHLSDAERMAFVTLLAGQAVSWMRSQRGTSSLRAIFMMDEVFGYLPPSANPPSKLPMLTLLKQARAFGLGVVLATQNPVDLDYKGLSNAGTWFLGRLQTARDKARVVDGLEGAAAAAGDTLDRGRLDRLLSGLGSRTFLLHSVHDDDETVFRTRWTLSYLRGPLAREEIARLTPRAEPAAAAEPPATGNDRPAGSSGGPRPRRASDWGGPLPPCPLWPGKDSLRDRRRGRRRNRHQPAVRPARPGPRAGRRRLAECGGPRRGADAGAFRPRGRLRFAAFDPCRAQGAGLACYKLGDAPGPHRPPAAVEVGACLVALAAGRIRNRLSPADRPGGAGGPRCGHRETTRTSCDTTRPARREDRQGPAEARSRTIGGPGRQRCFVGLGGGGDLRRAPRTWWQPRARQGLDLGEVGHQGLAAAG